MKPSIKINGTFPFGFENNYVIKLLSKDNNIQRVNQKEDLFIEVVGATPFLSKEFKKAKKKLLVSGENVKYKLNLFKFLQYISKKSSLPFSKLNKILPNSLLKTKLGLMRPKYYNYVKNLSNKPQKGKYAIISNDIKGKNIFNLPFFLQRPFNIKELEKKKIKKIPKKFCCIIISNESAFDRIEFTKKLSKYKQVDIYGKTSLTNSDNSKLPSSFAKNHEFYSQYKFVICFENSFAKDYITEKLTNAMLGNSLPIYRGAPNIQDYFNTKSFINYDDYGEDYDKMIKEIIELDKDDKKYLDFLNQLWLTEENKKNIEKKQKELREFLERVVEE
jgi:hypothetical protein